MKLSSKQWPWWVEALFYLFTVLGLFALHGEKLRSHDATSASKFIYQDF